MVPPSSRIYARNAAPFVFMIVAQIIAASYAVLSKIIFTQGTSTVVFMIYQFSVATIFISPLAYFVEKQKRPPLTLSIVCWSFVLALLGATLFQNLFSASLDFISSTTQSAILNLFPAFTYLLSVASRQEAAELSRFRGIGKLLGTIISVGGAFTMIFWQGNVARTVSASSGNWNAGFVLATLAILSLSTWLVLQGSVIRRYPAELSMTAMMYFWGTIQTCALAAFTSRRAADWKLSWDLELLNIVFGGVLNSGIGIFIFTWCARVKGPLFVAVFAPLTLLLTAVMEALFLGQSMTIGSTLGSLLIVGGLYLFLWAKSKEDDPEQTDAATSPLLQQP